MSGQIIILTSFGSADEKIRSSTIDALAGEIQKNFPTFDFAQAYTSNFMIKKLKSKGIEIKTLPEKISELRAAGYKKMIVLPSHITPGEEFDYKIKPCAAEDVEILPPLFDPDLNSDFNKKIVKTVLECFIPAEDEDLILIGHGSPHRHNPIYENVQTLADKISEKIHVGVVEPDDTPNFDDVAGRLKNRNTKKILLAPMLFNGGVHLAEDIAGEDKNSWKSRLERLNFEVRVNPNGLGNFKKIHALYIERLERFAKK